jgi:hypothetical protein
MSPLMRNRRVVAIADRPDDGWDQQNARIRVVVLPNGVPQGLDHAFS